MKFKVGQRVWSMNGGWGKVVRIGSEEPYPVIVVHDEGQITHTFTEEGFWRKLHLRPSLFLDEPENWPDPPPPKPELKVDDKVWVRDLMSYQKHWKPRYFAGWSDDEKIMCFDRGATSFSAGTTEPCKWDEYKLHEEE